MPPAGFWMSRAAWSVDAGAPKSFLLGGLKMFALDFSNIPAGLTAAQLERYLRERAAKPASAPFASWQTLPRQVRKIPFILETNVLQNVAIGL